MSLIVELENPQDAAFIKQILEQIKGVKSVDEIQSRPMTDEEFGIELQKIADRATPENCISYEEFKMRINAKLCELKSQKKQVNH